MQLFVTGRRKVYHTLREQLIPDKPLIWFHAASLGEYEQGVPVMEALKNDKPNHQFLITFFSPSGYEIKKNNAFAKTTTYLPLDTKVNAKRFLDIAKPEMVFFIKYEFWPNFLNELKSRNIRTFLLSGVFREKQLFFKPYGGWMRNSLEAFEHFFLQDLASAKMAESINLANVTISGDTRFDRVSHQIEMDNSLSFVEEFVKNNLCVVCGSTWPEDDNAILHFIHKHEGAAKVILAPHQMNEDKITALQKRCKVKTIRYTQKENVNLQDYDVLILDTIGMLTKVYSYAHIAYVGGALGTSGLHNILEPATFGVPIITGPNIDKFPEAKRLRQLAGLYVVQSGEEFAKVVSKLISNPKLRTQTGMIAGHYVNSNTGATRNVMEYLKQHN